MAAERDPGVGQPRGRFRDFRRQLVRVREMDAHPQGVILAQDPRELPGHALRHDDGYFRADSDELDMRDRAQAAEQVIELVIG